jgi:uncharacterized protein with HEPN domain
MPRDSRRELLYLADIVESARTVERWLAERDGQWHDDEILLNAVLRQLSVIGEAASCLSDDMRGRLADVPWSEIRQPSRHGAEGARAASSGSPGYSREIRHR